MKKKHSIIFYSILSLFFLFSCQKKKAADIIISPIKEKKKKGDINGKHKKGIEHIADYQKEIRKPLDAEKSTYKEGYLVQEFNKATAKSFAKKSANIINPVFIERGPNNVPGRSRGIAIDPNNPNRWYVGSVGGGVWLTEDGGASWSSLTDFQIPNLATSTIVISPTNINTLYVGTGEPFGNLGRISGSGVFKTIDGGATWQHLTATITFGDVGRIIINPTDENNVLIATSEGIFRTTDGGTTWTQTYTSTGTVQDLDVDPTNFNIQYGSINTFGIIKSEDGGITWTTIFDRFDYNAAHSRFETSVSPADPNTVFLSVYTSGSSATVGVNTDFYVSRDKGATFTNLTTTRITAAVSEQEATAAAAAANLITNQGWYDNVILAHPHDANIFYIGAIAVFKVTVTGNNFASTSIASGYDNKQINSNVHVDQHGLFTILGANKEFKILLANDGGVYSTTSKEDPGATEGDWSNAVSGKNSTQFYGASKQNGEDNYLAGAQDNGTWISSGNNSNKNKTYSTVRGGDGFEVVWHYNNPKDFLATSQYNSFSRYINYTQTATYGDISENAPFYSKLANANNNPDVVFTVTKDGVWRSTDFGQNWNLTSITDNYASSASSALNVKVSTADPYIVWAGSRMTESESFTLHVSQDNGKSFSKTSAFNNPIGNHNLAISGLATSYIERNRAYALFSGQGAAKVLKTEDLGNTWTDISGFSTGVDTGFPDVAVHCIVEMPFNKNLLWVGTDIGIFETEDGGETWSIVSDFISVAVYDMKVINDQIVIATYGRGIWSATISELNSYVLADFLTFPTFSIYQKEIESLETIVTYSVPRDGVNRVKIFIDDVEQTEIIQDFNTGVTYTFETKELAEGSHKLGVQLFDDTNNLQTPIDNKEFDVIDFETPSTTLTISEFKNSNIYIYDDSFIISSLSNELTANVVSNSDHPYKSNTTYSMVLKQPLTIDETNKNFTYENVAVIEPYTTNPTNLSKFYDFVIIEASTDLKVWKTIDKYDSRRYSEWLTEFNKGEDATFLEALFKKQTVDLTTKGLSEGETVVFRFSLISDSYVESYGWVLKSINDVATASVDDVLSDKKIFSVYPTVSKGNFTLFAKNTLGNTKMTIFNMKGKQVYNNNIDFSKNNKQEVSVNLNAGVYIINLIDENNKKSSTKIIIE
ncbi:MAG: T9SS type A sorting domain-containing protein [Polaribacter sp.]|uniref:T9SS type A sorting domain-containing protein n=1 Tax=Polaribacter sp. TaxID=1920175 RepID=UPI00326777BE